MLTGENGILNRAKEAKEENEKQSDIEKIKLSIMGAMNEQGVLTVENLENELKNYGVSVQENEFPVTVNMDSGTFYIDEQGNVSNKKILTAKTIANSTKNEIINIYGSEVKGYECDNSKGVNAWKIFYSDGNNIYLITDDYIKYDYCPNSKTQLIKKNSDYSLSMNDVIKDYDGSDNILDYKLKKLNSSYFFKEENGKEVDNYSSANANMKAVAYMMDTKIWKGFLGNNADYAIGGPTIEMLMNSYSKKYGVNYTARASSKTGYQISTDGGGNWAINGVGILNINDSLYIIDNDSGARSNAMWLASPSDLEERNLLRVFGNGDVSSYDYTGYDMGFRPIVCLNAKVSLQKNDDGTYTIIK